MTNHILRKALLPTLALVLAAGASVAKAEVGVTDSTISFGQAAALEGPASALGTGMRQGILAAFAEANRNGGVGGRQLELKSYDDGYEPEQSISHTQTLINQDQVFALIGAVGTPTASATQPIATEAGVPFIGPFTGAGFLRAPELANVVNVRASYGQETEAWIKHLTEDLGYDRIAILYQDDSFGRVGLDGVNKALQARGLSLVAEGTYKRNTTAVKEALLAIRKSDPQAVVMVGAYKPIAEFIKLARKVKMDATFVNISFVGSDALAKELGPDGEGVVITQVVPFPWDNSIPLVQQYQAALKAQDAAATPGFVSLEGYIVGRIAIAALEKAGGELTRESFLKAVYGTGTFDLGGLTLSYGAGDNQGSDAVFLTVIQPDGSFKAVQRLGSSS
jgi:ABC-type branched-subunit amino acid transport system substrate-binding protein